MEIVMNGKTISLKYSFRALMIYENITQKSFSPKGLSDVIVFFYSVVVSSSKNTTLSFDDFMDWLDENPTAVAEFSEWLSQVFAHQASMVNQDVKVEKKEVEEAEKN